MPFARPSAHSASLTATTTSVQRVATRSQRRAAAPIAPSAASKDHECGLKAVGMEPRSSSLPLRPALLPCRCTTSGRTMFMIWRSLVVSRRTPT